MLRRVLKLKEKMGLLDDPYAGMDFEKGAEVSLCGQHRGLARIAAEKSAVLLKNQGVLPLKKEQKIALIGPNAEIAQLGSYTYYNFRDPNKEVDCVAQKALSLRQALEEKFGVEKVQTARGCGFGLYEEEMASRALAIAKDADVILFAGGHNSIGGFGGDAGGEEQRNSSSNLNWAQTSGEGYDMATTDLSHPQKKLLKELSARGKPIVLLVYSGQPLSITEELEDCAAVLWTYGVGCEGNPAVADLLAGDVIPSGRLPFSLPRSVGHLPCYYNHYRMGKGSLYQRPGSMEQPGMDYVFSDPSALLPFGYGLSYTQFEYEDLSAKQQGNHCKVQVTVWNTGAYDADHSVLIFGRNVHTKIVSGITRKLVDFKRVHIKKGESLRVDFEIPMERFSYIGVDMKYVAAHGEIELYAEDQKTSFTVL
jgi:beta-glucosidase